MYTKINKSDKAMNLEELNPEEKKELQQIEKNVESCVIEIKRKKYEIGKMLDKAKDILPHGSFKTWQEQTFGEALSYSTGHFYMRCYRSFKDNPKALDIIPSKYLHKLTENDFPVDTRKHLAENMPKKGFSKDNWDAIVAFYDHYKDCDAIDEEGFLWLVKRTINDKKDRLKSPESEADKHWRKFNSATEMREKMYIKVHNSLKRLERLIKKANKGAWRYPFNPNDKLHQSVHKRIDGNIEKLEGLTKKLKRLKKVINGGEGLIRPTISQDGMNYLSNPNPQGLEKNGSEQQWDGTDLNQISKN